MSSWRQVTIYDVATQDGTVDGPFGSNLPASEYTAVGIPVIRGVNLSLGIERFKDFNYVFVGQQTANKLKRSMCQPDDIIFTKKGTLGQTGIIPRGGKFKKFLLSSNQMRVRIDKHVADSLYVYYFVSSKYGRMRIQADAMTAGVPKINLGYLRRFQLLVPELGVQQKIAAILLAYDELIENNKRRIALLDKLAEEIYREWFVRFRFPGHKNVKAIKGVPKGWSLKRFHEIVEYYIGGGWGEDNQSTSFSDAAFVIRGTDIPDVQAGEFEGCPFRFHKPSNLKSRTLQPNDFVFEVSGGSKDQLLGRNVLITERVLNFFDAPVIAASFCKQIRFRSELVLPYFMKYFMKLYYDCDLVGIYQVQSTGISNYQFESFLKFQTIILPPEGLQKQFDDQVKPIVEVRDDIALANIALRKTRDLLLPRLISGKLSVENLDIQFPPGMAGEFNAQFTETAHA